MDPNFANWDDQRLEQALQAFTEGLSDAEMARLEAECDAEDLQDFENAIAAIQWTHVVSIEAPPQQVMQTLKARAAGWIEQQNQATRHSGSEVSQGATPTDEQGHSGRGALGGRTAEHPAPRRDDARRAPWAVITGWAAAAAMFVMWVGNVGNKATVDPADSASLGQEIAAAERLNNLVESAQDLVRVDWVAGEDPSLEGVTGEVIWSDAAQEGYMVFSGLAANDPTQEQFQLWVFDPTRADWEKLPVDGGVFDIGAAQTAAGKVVIPIRPTLPVQNIALFAITVEKPGGVVVSKREKLILTASPS